MGVDVCSVYVHSAICETYGVTVFHRCIVTQFRDLLVFQRSIVNWSGGTCILSICAFCYM